MKKYDLVLIGGGIVGVSTAWQMKQRYPDAAILLVEKESALAQHQTGHNSGVIHAGVYYPPGSLKADFCRRDRSQTIDFCRQYGLPFQQCGKLLVATDAVEYQRMGALEVRCAQNGIHARRLSGAELKKQEPICRKPPVVACLQRPIAGSDLGHAHRGVFARSNERQVRFITKDVNYEDYQYPVGTPGDVKSRCNGPCPGTGGSGVVE